jgi:hypothetical protein
MFYAFVKEFSVVVQFEIHRAGLDHRPVGNYRYAQSSQENIFDRQSQAAREKKRQPEKQGTPRKEDFSQAAARIVKEATENH